MVKCKCCCVTVRLCIRPRREDALGHEEWRNRSPHPRPNGFSSQQRTDFQVAWIAALWCSLRVGVSKALQRTILGVAVKTQVAAIANTPSTCRMCRMQLVGVPRTLPAHCAIHHISQLTDTQFKITDMCSCKDWLHPRSLVFYVCGRHHEPRS